MYKRLYAYKALSELKNTVLIKNNNRGITELTIEVRRVKPNRY